MIRWLDGHDDIPVRVAGRAGWSTTEVYIQNGRVGTSIPPHRPAYGSHLSESGGRFAFSPLICSVVGADVVFDPEIKRTRIDGWGASIRRGEHPDHRGDNLDRRASGLDIPSITPDTTR